MAAQPPDSPRDPSAHPRVPVPPAPTSAAIQRAARKIHARLVARDELVDPEELLGIISRETGAAGERLAGVATQVLATFETLDGEALPGNNPHDATTPLHDTAVLAVALADGLRRRTGRDVLVLCGHRFPIEDAPGWCRDRGGFSFVVERRARHPVHPD